MLSFENIQEKKRERRRLFSLYAGAGLVIIGLFLGGIHFFYHPRPVLTVSDQVIDSQPLSQWSDANPTLDTETTEEPQKSENEDLLPLPPPPPPSMEQMKNDGCVADGFLSGYGGDIKSSLALVNHSECSYLHRALETWLKPPDFKLARKIQSQVTRKGIVYGMFIAEAIDTTANYSYPQENRDFKFRDMCRIGSRNFWGEHTCKPSFEREEYRQYLQYITERAMDMGIQSFLFGEVFYQESSDLSKAVMPTIIQNMREYAAFRGMQIEIGAQTNDITDAHYLGLFDYIEGGVGLHSDGSIEDGPCSARWYQNPGDWCWALLWNSQFKNKAKNVFVHLDWSGKIGDDMSVFTRMDKETRTKTLIYLHHFFQQQKVGFLLPLLATLHRDNDGCYGPKPRYYSASRKYTCQDEETINALLKGK